MTQLSHHAEQAGRGPTNSSADTWAYVLQHVLVLIVFIAAVFFRNSDTAATWPQHWAALFIGAGILFLGFGAGMLFYQRRQRAAAAHLRDEFSGLSARARMLSTEMDDYLKRKQSSGS